MQAPYLTGERIYLRRMRLDDKDHALAWHDSVFPISAARAEKVLRDESTVSWNPPKVRLAVIRRVDDQIIGRVTIHVHLRRLGYIDFRFAPWLENPDESQADVLRVIVPWLRDEHELMTVVAQFAADCPETIAAAEALGMELVARLREYLAAPGGRVDQLHYQAVGRPWEVRDA